MSAVAGGAAVAGASAAAASRRREEIQNACETLCSCARDSLSTPTWVNWVIGGGLILILIVFAIIIFRSDR